MRWSTQNDLRLRLRRRRRPLSSIGSSRTERTRHRHHEDRSMTVAPASPDIAEASVREFRKGHIQDLSLDRDHQDAWLRKHPVTDEASLRPLEDRIASLRRDELLVADGSANLVLSNCVLNLVSDAEKQALFAEILRVLRRGGCSVTVTAWKGKEGECWDHNEAVIYRGPFHEVRDDDGHVFADIGKSTSRRGE